MVLPVVLIHANVEGLAFADEDLFAITLFTLVLLVLQVHAVLVGEPLVVTEESAAGQSGNLWRGLPPHQVTILLVVHHFSNGVWKQVSWEVPQRCVVANSEAAHDSVLLLICEVVEQLSQVWQLVVVNRVVDWYSLTIWTNIVATRYIGRMSGSHILG